MISPARRRIVYQAIKAAILKGTDVEYWAITMYRQLDAGVLTDEQVAELEVLIDEYYNPPEPEPTPEPEPESVDEPAPETSTVPDYEAMTKHELYEWAEAHGITVYESWTKAEIVAAIQAALSEGE